MTEQQTKHESFNVSLPLADVNVVFDALNELTINQAQNVDLILTQERLGQNPDKEMNFTFDNLILQVVLLALGELKVRRGRPTHQLILRQLEDYKRSVIQEEPKQVNDIDLE